MIYTTTITKNNLRCDNCKRDAPPVFTGWTTDPDDDKKHYCAWCHIITDGGKLLIIKNPVLILNPNS